MRKLYFVCLFMTLFACVVPASAQLKYGVSGGLLMKELDFSKMNSEVSRQGWYVGPTVEIGLPLALKVDGSVQYTHYELTCGEEVLKQNYISIPLNLKLSFGLPKLVGFYLAGGPQFDNRLDGSEKIWELEGDKFALNKNSMSWNVGGGFRVLGRIQVGITYNIVKKEKGDNAEDMVDSFRKNSWRVGATVLF